jgi:ATP/maltotriose-dependent transcriptional regulator MalT
VLRDDLTTDDVAALCDAAWWLGRIGEVVRLSEECFDRYVAEDRPEEAARTALDAAITWFLRGGIEIGTGWLSRARRLLVDRPIGPVHGYLTWLDAMDPARSEEEVLAAARRLRALGERLDDPGMVAGGLLLEGSVAIRGGDLGGFDLVDEAMLPVLAGRVQPEMGGNLYCTLMSLCHELGDFRRALRWTEVTERWCDTFESAVMFAGICRVHRAQLLRLGGDLARAEAEAARAARELAELNIEAAAAAHYEVGEAQRLRGEHDAALLSYEAAVALGHSGQPGGALLALAERRTDEALSQLRRSLAEEGAPTRRAPLLSALVEVTCAQGDRVSAAQAVEELGGIAAAYPTDGFRLWAELARGMMLLRCAPVDAGAHPSVHPHSHGAVDHLRRALILARECGAAYHAGVARGLLEEAAAPVEAEPPGGLTPREAEILALVAAGLGNRQVAARLVISEKTVARHLANIYAKLDVGSRTAASAWAHQHGLLHHSM